ncbi:unnamed protein product [Tenebrio molitor]|nr:unnamed protein product [Tenebrio molitor]
MGSQVSRKKRLLLCHQSINHGCSTKAPRTNPFEALPSPARI